MTLRPVTNADYARVASWPSQAEVFGAWRGPAGEVNAGHMRDFAAREDVQGFVGEVGGQPVSYGELWRDDEEQEVELAHLLVDPGMRGQGFGGQLVTLLLGQARRTGLPRACLRVHPENLVARRCYERCGFRRLGPEQEARFNAPQPRVYAWYELPLE